MKRFYTPLLVLGLLVTTVACEKLKDAFTFDFDVSSDFTIPSTISLNVPLSLNTPDITTNLESEMENNNTNADLVKNVSLKEISLTATSPSGQTMSFLNSIEIYISADGLDEVLIAEKQNIPSDVGSTLDLETTGVGLDDYVKKDAFDLRVVVVTDETILQDIDIQNDMVFEITADPL